MSEADIMEPAVPPPPASTAAQTVTVGCKLPNGLELHLDEMVEYKIPMPGGGYVIEKRSRRLPETFTLNGRAIDLARIAATGSVPHLIVGGYGITSGVPRDFWDRWLVANERSDIVREKIVFAMPDEGRAQGFALEHAAVRTGMEPIDPDAPGRTSPEFRKIQPGTRSAA